MSVVKDLISSFLEEMADFAEPRRDRNRLNREGMVPVRIQSRDEAGAIRRREGEGGRLRRRRERFDVFDD